MNATYILPLFHKPNFYGYSTLYCTHILHQMSILDNISLDHNWFHIALFLLSFRWHSSEIIFNGWWFLMITKTYWFFADTHWYLFNSLYPIQWIEHSLTYEWLNHDNVYCINVSWNKFSLTTKSYRLQIQEQTVLRS